MKFTIEECVNKEGKKLYIHKYIGEVTKCVLTDGFKSLIPIVDSISYDQEKEVFFVTDGFNANYGNTTEPIVKANLYFYLDFGIEPVGLGYIDIVPGFFPVCIKNDANDHWFNGYQSFKHDLCLGLGEYLNKNKEHHSECARKMLNLLDKKLQK